MATPPAPRAAVSMGDLASAVLASPDELEDWIRGHGGLETESGATVSTVSALRVATVHRCVSILADQVGTIPLGVYRAGGSYAERDVDHPLDRVLSRRPNRWQSAFEFRRQLTTHLLLRGNAFALIVRSPGAAQVSALLPLAPDRMVVEQRPDTTIAYTYTRGDGREQTLAEADVLHLRALSLDGVTGLSVIAQAREAIGESIEGGRHASRLLRNGVTPTGAVKVEGELSAAAYERLKADLNQHAGAGNAGRVMVFEGGAEFSPMQMSSSDAQFLENRKYTSSQIAQIFGVPPFILGDTEKQTSFGGGLEQLMIATNRFTFGPWLTLWEGAVSRDLLSDREAATHEIRFDERAMLRGDTAARTQQATAWLQWGVASPNEVRAMEGMGPREGGDRFYSPPNEAGGESEARDDEPER